MNNKKMGRKCFGLLLSVVAALVVFSPNVKASELVTVDSSNPIISEKNSLVIEKAPEKKGYSVNTFNNSRMKVTEKNEINPGTASHYKYEDLKKYGYLRFEKDYSSKMIEIISPKNDDKIEVTFNQVGKYNNKNVGAKVTYTNFTFAQVPKADYTQGILEVSESMFSGFWYSNLASMDITYDFFDAETKEKINIDKDVVLSVHSLNQYEFAQYLEAPDDSKVYLLDNSFVKEETDPYDSTKKVWMGTDPEFDKIDWLGEDGFARASVSFQIQKNPLKIRVGKDASQHNLAVWNSLSSANFTTTPENPKKAIIEDGKDVEENQLTSKPLDTELVYKISQKVNVLGQDLLERYKVFSFEDTLPAEVDYVSAELADNSGNVYDDAGEITYDEENRLLKFVASNDFIQKQMKFEGETYSLVIHTKVNDKAKNESSFNNKARVNINDEFRETNEVITKVPAKEVEKEDIDKPVIVQEEKEDIPKTGAKKGFWENVADFFTFWK
ncbi:isopeptide-forming domain-containing fimbrial protein [Listeria welshimeri]|uniref:isopeptide-forming domain-containing fimbrial protein n=1 Tax=Listeria welshimeri TaxID=1643 RepID=UPI0016269971|nr:isopeptide-forming domain-containing fimbrial protein [Listeria welshimeri]MBC1342355.1 isopeptide-forming domain-containing fimbrial protein [Listeria welshimeri]MBC1350725.1 isopeptide-forming domain-containing fimbrial protein [Listeria welshimeri]MBC1705799.1 isopeptide-forming domain-containing fimbrial protein [Listeria welshimeri]MBF2342588.1 isopeptide-forming domain-containing fimbrial protein [Listeria welshimeri]